MMTEKMVFQYQYERESWLRMLAFLKKEMVFLKIRLSEIIKNESDNKLLEQVECFQNSFLNIETTITLLQQEIREQYILTSPRNKAEEAIAIKLLERHNRLRDEMGKMWEEFSSIQDGFCQYFLASM